MFITRDEGEVGMICFWNHNTDEIQRINGCWNTLDNNFDFLFCVYPEEFKQLFPKQKLPRKGSCKYVELRLYIPGEGD